MKKIKLIIIGGFLGSGKTTLLCRLAKYFTNKGLRVGLITNDQTDNIVDTHLVKFEGYKVEEVAGGCFCCKFNDLVEATKKLVTKSKPDVILAEPVGSCTDLVATVIRPLKTYYKKNYDIRLYTALLDPRRAQDMIISRKVSGFSENVAYVFRKQLEESDIIALNKIDTLGPKRIKKILFALRKEFPQARVMGISSRTGKGFAAWIKAVESSLVSGKNIATVDYDVYAQGEAELAWLNSVVNLSAKNVFPTGKFLRELVIGIRKTLNSVSGEVAHLKLALSTNKGSSFIHLTQNFEKLEFFKKDAGSSSNARLIVNARVHTTPRLLARAVTCVLRELCKKKSIGLKIESMKYFRPTRPVPVHRFK